MSTLKKIEENLKAISNIEAITKIYQEIAQSKMAQIRQRVLKNREFIDELLRVFTLSKNAYFAQKIKKREKKEFFIKKAREKVNVFLSCNELFYGPLMIDILKEIEKELKEKGGDLVIISKIGKYLVEKSEIKSKIYYFDLDDENPKREEVKKIIEFLKNYKEVIIFHGKFQTILNQKVAKTNISGETIKERKLENVKKYLFEPSPEAVLEFFETELISAFFNQTILEHRLSRYATRMVAMYRATENAERIKKKIQLEGKKIKHQLLNRKQIEIFSGFQLWNQSNI